MERIGPNTGHPVWDIDTGEGLTALERIGPNTGHPVWDIDTGEGLTAVERIVPNTGHPVWDSDCGQIATVAKNAAIKSRRSVAWQHHAPQFVKFGVECVCQTDNAVCVDRCVRNYDFFQNKRVV